MISPAYALDYAKDGFPPLQAPQQNVTNQATQTMANLNTAKIAQVENQIFGQTYDRQHLGIRLNRLEKSIFNKTFPRLSYEQRINNILINYKNSINNRQSTELSRLERDVFHRTYENEPEENRISRLERQVLGTVFDGDLKDRYNTLNQVVPQYLRNSRAQTYPNYPSYTTTTTYAPNSYYPQTYSSSAYSPYYTNAPILNSTRGWRGLAGSLGNFFMGTPTGLSPQIYSPYINNYGPDYQRGMYSNRGWNMHNMYTGSNAGVHILP